jgi:hypothetical protein
LSFEYSAGVWHKIEAGRSGREGYLKLDSQVNFIIIQTRAAIRSAVIEL